MGVLQGRVLVVRAAVIILGGIVVMPLVRAAGIDPIHFGLTVTVNLGIGQQPPPMASVLTTACAIAKADIWEVSRASAAFVAVLLGVLALCTYVPAVPMWLVQYVYRQERENERVPPRAAR